MDTYTHLHAHTLTYIHTNKQREGATEREGGMEGGRKENVYIVRRQNMFYQTEPATWLLCLPCFERTVRTNEKVTEHTVGQLPSSPGLSFGPGELLRTCVILYLLHWGRF